MCRGWGVVDPSPRLFYAARARGGRCLPTSLVHNMGARLARLPTRHRTPHPAGQAMRVRGPYPRSSQNRAGMPLQRGQRWGRRDPGRAHVVVVMRAECGPVVG